MLTGSSIHKIFNESSLLIESSSNKSEYDILYNIFGDKNKELSSVVKMIKEEKYEELYNKYNLSDRSIKSDNKNDIKKYSFLDALIKNKFAAGLDWKFGKEDIDFNIKRIKNGSKISIPDKDTDLTGDDYIDYLNKYNKNNKYIICKLLDGESDEINIIIIDNKQSNLLDSNHEVVKMYKIKY